MHVASLVAAIALGLVGGILGAIYTRLNTLVGATRKKILAKIKIDFLKKVTRIADCLIISVSIVTLL